MADEEYAPPPPPFSHQKKIKNRNRNYIIYFTLFILFFPLGPCGLSKTQLLSYFQEKAILGRYPARMSQAVPGFGVPP